PEVLERPVVDVGLGVGVLGKLRGRRITPLLKLHRLDGVCAGLDRHGLNPQTPYTRSIGSIVTQRDGSSLGSVQMASLRWSQGSMRAKQLQGGEYTKMPSFKQTILLVGTPAIL